MVELRNPFGLYQDTIYHISEANKEYDYICPECRKELIQRKGEIKIHHFSHKSNPENNCSSESSLHKYAKQVIAETKRIRVKNPFLSHSYLIFDKVEVEKPLLNGLIRPDLIGYIGEEKYLIEIKVTHGIGEEKLELIKKNGFSCIEINLSNLYKNVNNSMNMKEKIINKKARLVTSKEHQNYIYERIGKGRDITTQRETAQFYMDKYSELKGEFNFSIIKLNNIIRDLKFKLEKQSPEREIIDRMDVYGIQKKQAKTMLHKWLSEIDKINDMCELHPFKWRSNYGVYMDLKFYDFDDPYYFENEVRIDILSLKNESLTYNKSPLFIPDITIFHKGVACILIFITDNDYNFPYNKGAIINKFFEGFHNEIYLVAYRDILRIKADTPKYIRAKKL